MGPAPFKGPAKSTERLEIILIIDLILTLLSERKENNSVNVRNVTNVCIPYVHMILILVIRNSAARAVMQTLKFHHITKSLHWLKINKRIHYKLFP
jgi:hypothetical protein